MSVASWRSETATDALAAVRVGGGIRMDFAPTVDGTRAKHLAEADGWRVRFPRSVNGCEAVLLNTGGGIAGGDTVRLEASLQAGATVTVTSATAERPAGMSHPSNGQKCTRGPSRTAARKHFDFHPRRARQ